MIYPAPFSVSKIIQHREKHKCDQEMIKPMIFSPSTIMYLHLCFFVPLIKGKRGTNLIDLSSKVRSIPAIYITRIEVMQILSLLKRENLIQLWLVNDNALTTQTQGKRFILIIFLQSIPILSCK